MKSDRATYERLDGENVVLGRTDAAKPRDDKVNECGMVIVSAPVFILAPPCVKDIARKPSARIGIHVPILPLG